MTAIPSTGWKLPFNLAVLLHLLLLSSAILLPKYLQKNTIIPESYTVDLISITESPAELSSPPAAATPAPPEPPAAKIQQLKEVAAKKTAPIAPPIAETVQPEQVQAISIKPLKRKIKNKNAPDLQAQETRRQKELEQKQEQQALEARRQELLAEARRQRAVAAAEAKAAASEAVNALKHMLQTDAVASSAKTGQQSSSEPSRGTSNALADQYHANIKAHLHRFWALPDIKPWDPDLLAVVVIVISQNGQIISHSFEKRSGDRVFDQFVSKTIQDANPLPPIPGALKKQQYTLGFNFKPGGII
ncbi:MAG: TonB C-terminal domain-containing protein [Proteobacteria bacterium]|nr:TonB C-terminal domain-containing protein [Pseudomonadota bacterium]MBU1233723.1 TonB C-terminal domain-containing protein [Pseudomonadota bacterium]MBU1420486.1 TonB C-terminal domain-containing protein [Pseudomonadota bacterium]MBU1456049.1 TonB C-terminal domain-containing protein [Pseudomonadota bacterium]